MGAISLNLGVHLHWVLLVNSDLSFYCLDACFYDLVTWTLEIRGRRIITHRQGFNRLWMQVRPVAKLEEIQSHKVIKVASQNFVVWKIKTIIELRKLKDNLNHFWLAGAWEACVIFSPENSLDTLVDHLRADGVGRMVRRGIEILMLLWHDQYCFIVLHFTVFTSIYDSFLDVSPNIRCVVPIEVNDLFLVLALILAVALKGNGVQIILISFASYDVDGLVHTDLWVLLAVFYLITGQNAIIAYLLKIDLSFLTESSSFLEILNFWELLNWCRLSLTEISAQSCFTHSGQTNWNQEKLGNVLHFWVFE